MNFLKFLFDFEKKFAYFSNETLFYQQKIIYECIDINESFKY